MLQKIPVSVNLLDGVDTKTDEKISLKLSEMENCSHQGKGTPKKRKEFNSLPKDIEGGGLISSGKYSFGYNNQSLLATENAVYVFLEGTQNWRKISDATLSSSRGKFVTNISKNDFEHSGNVKTDTQRAFVVAGQTAPIVKIIDEATGVEVYSFNVEKDPRIIQIENEIITASWVGGVSPDLYFRNHSTGAFSIIANDSTGRFDLFDDGAFAYLVYTTVTEVKIIKLQKDGTVISTQNYPIGADTIDTGSAPTITIYENVIHITFLVNRGGSKFVRYFSVDDSLAVVTAQLDFFQTISSSESHMATTVVASQGNNLLGPLSLWYFYEDKTLGKFGIGELSLTNFLSEAPIYRSGIDLASKAFNYGGKAFALVKQVLPENINWLLIDCFANPQGMINNFDTTIQNSSTVFGLNPVSEDFTISYLDDEEFLKSTKIDFTYKSSGDFVEFGGNTFLPGTLPLRYNGSKLIESQFLSRPEITAIGTSGGGSFVAGTYTFYAVYEYTEPNGNIIRSEDSVEFEKVMGANEIANISVSTLKLSYISDSEVKVRIYRKLQSELAEKLIVEFAVNSKSADTVQINDIGTSTDGNAVLYSTGLLLPNQAMPAISSYAFHNNRLFGVRSEDGNEILYSNKYIIGEGIFFNNFNTINVEDNQGGRSDNVSAIHGMDNKLIVFKNNAISAIFGDGPDNTGDNGAFAEAEPVTTDVGCINPRSLVLVSEGLMFKSNKGIYMLTRGMQSSYIGNYVERFNPLQISGSVLMDDINQVRFTTFDGETLVYDYYYKQWSWFNNTEGNSCFIDKGKMIFTRPDGSYLVEGLNYSDNGSFIKQKVTTAWLKVGNLTKDGISSGGPQEFQRVYRMLILGEYKGSHKMLVKVYYDYNDYVEDEYLLTPQDTNYERTEKPSIDEVHNGANTGQYQYNIHFKRQKCESIKISIEDVRDGTVNESYQLTNLTFIVGKKVGAFKNRSEVAY